jgi:methylmalonyl-CoA mutase N-terminal domain/subunit
MEQAAYEYFAKIDELGGMVEAIKQNYPQREIADASFRYQCEVDDGERVIVGVNKFQNEHEDIEIHKVDPGLEQKQIDRLKSVRAKRDSAAVESTLTVLKEAASGGDNLMEPLIECARAHASEGEIVEALQEVFGTYTETPVF